MIKQDCQLVMALARQRHKMETEQQDHTAKPTMRDVKTVTTAKFPPQDDLMDELPDLAEMPEMDPKTG